jgi:preprotein translocase subunit Sec61beta
MADNKIQLPSSGGGLMRYSEGSSSKFQFKPGHVIILVIIVILIEIVLHWQAASWVGP